MCHNKIVLYGSNLLAPVLKFGIDTTKNPWYHIDLKKLVLPIPIFQPLCYRTLFPSVGKLGNIL